jgi:hypothetical protein
VEGIVNVRAYSTVFDTDSFERIKVDLIKEWKAVPVKKENYGILGAEVRLEFDEEYSPGKDPLYVEIDFVYDGKTFSAIAESVYDLS